MILAGTTQTRKPVDGAPGVSSTYKFLQRKAQEAIYRKPHPYPPPFDRLDDEIAKIVLARWVGLCEEMFEYLALEHPDQLLRLMQSPRIPITDLTFAAEIAGRISDSEKVRPMLLDLLRHPTPIVREGAIYGLAGHVDSVVISELQRLIATDLSQGVRTAAADLLAITP